ncbi:hypothetical protein K2173_026225 [Erythroxylum novogranatense]|uniref:Uncharacterized protein n=1 Tax=Erythroxylum novogranatense TaxID=1862640 RepID=A0AAV8SBH1_9ROSI|nr:hypothetical protein K2173_026225 [Erythroxylum novogranatense]
MHGCGSGSPFLVNAEVDSMGGVVDGGIGIGIKTSPRRAAIENAQAELRQEYDVREERRRELEFLEKGGNPLDFKFGNASSVSVQSTSVTDHHAEQFVTSEAKGSFVLTASPHGDSVESSGRPLVPASCEPNSADNFNGDNELLERDRKHFSRRNNVSLSEQSSPMDGTPNIKESEDSAIVHSYARRNRSRTNRDGTRLSSRDVFQSTGGHGLSLQVRADLRESKGLKSEINNRMDQNVPSSSDPKVATSNGDIVPQMENFKKQSKELDGVQALETKVDLPKSKLLDDRLDALESNNSMNKQNHEDSKIDAHKTPVVMIPGESFFVEGKGQVIAGVAGFLPSEGTGKTENETSSAHLNGFSDSKRNGNVDQNGTAAIGVKGLHSESSCTQNSIGLDVNCDSVSCITRKFCDTNGVTQQMSELDRTQNIDIDKLKNEQNEAKAVETDNTVSDKNVSVHQNNSNRGSLSKIEEEVQGTSDLRNEVKCPNIDEVEQKIHTISAADKEVDNELGDDSDPSRDCPGGVQITVDCSEHEITESKQSEKACPAPDPLSCSVSKLKSVNGAHEDFILEEARIIEAKHKRIAELSICTTLTEGRKRCHWDFVLEEMTWLANDFTQERLWKMTSAAQICRRIALTSRLRAQNQQSKLKEIAYILAKAVMEFWQSAELLLDNDDQGVDCKNCKHDSGRFDGMEFSRDKMGETPQEKCKHLATQNLSRNSAVAIQKYAVRFLRCNGSPVPPLQAEVPTTPDRVFDLGIMEVSWDDQLTEESLFYVVPSGAMETYRNSIESHFAQRQKIVNGIQEEIDTSIYDGAADFEYHENTYDEEEGETSAYYLHGGFEGSKSTKHDQKKRKRFMKSYTARSVDVGAELPYGDTSVSCQQSILMSKRPGNNMPVGPVLPKRMRTASRQRFISPFSVGTPVVGQTPAKTDVSSGDTSSFQDDQTTLHGGLQIQKSMEAESVGEFEKQVLYDCAETSMKLKKKKKAKNLGSTYEQGWQLESAVHNEQRDNLKKRLDGYQFESNGISGLHGQHPAKKTKIMKHSLENTFDNMTPLTGSIPSPATSQMSNMSNSKFMKIIGRDRGNKKTKSLKISAGQLGPGSPWSLFEDQALVVLVHDMGPNWELVSDAINSTLQFKCIFRKPKECKERHKILMDKGAGDGADSAEDSGSTQSYPSTLPGIPKGSARQLFQRLQGPMEEDMLKSHFEKIIMIGKREHYRSQNDNQDPKQLAVVHNSHALALSQAYPNYLSGVVLTPLDLCDANTSNPDVLSLGYQASQASGLAMPQGAVSSMLPTSGVNSPMQGSSGMILGNSSPMQSGVVNTLGRDGRYNVARSSLPVDEQQRLQHYNQMLASRNLQQSNLPVSGTMSGTDRGVRVLPGGTGMGIVPGMNRSMPMSRPGFQGMHSSPMLNSGSVLSSGIVGMSSAVNVHPSGQGNSIRPRETFNTMRTYPGHPQQQHQGSPQPSHIPGTHHPHLQGPNHGTGSGQQVYAVRLAKERQMQQRLLQQQQQQQQQQFANSSALMPNTQLPRSSCMQNNSQIQPPISQQPVSLPPLTPSSPMTQISVHQQKTPHHGLSKNPQTGVGGLTNPIAKQRQRQSQQQQFQQPGRQHPQQRQHSQSPQHTNIGKGMGRGNVMANQNVSIDHPHPNGLSLPAGNQGSEKGEEMRHLMQGQGLYSANLNPVQPSKPLIPPQTSNNSQPQSKVFSGLTPPQSSKQLHQMSSPSDSTQSQVPAIGSGQAVPTQMMASNHQHLQQSPTMLHQKQSSQAQSNFQGMLQRNHQANSDLPIKPQTDKVCMDHEPLHSISQMASSTALPMPQSCNDSASSAQVSIAIPQWNASEPLYDSCLPNLASQVGSVGSPPLTNSSGIETVPSVSQGLGQRHSSGSFGQHGQNAAAQWQQQQQPSNHSTTLPQPSQQVFQLQEQQLPQEQKCSPMPLPQHQQSQQTSHSQSAQGNNMYMRSSNS